MGEDPTNARWQEFESLGEEVVRKRVAMSLYGEEKTALARTWLDHKRSSRVAEDNAAILASAKEANSLARAANDLAAAANATADDAAESARLAAEAAKTNNTIATLALIVAIIAITISIIGTFIGKHQ